jgi:glycine/D-amino acid oxidase-like deaminating enzyme/nitrite reductase/ring-hydroxylating ferredoxin subunit
MSTAKTIPIWDTEVNTEWSALDTGHADIVVIGAGVAGLTTALSLSRKGRQVTLIEKDAINAGESQRTTAHLASALDDRFYKLARYFGAEGASLAAASHAAAIDWIESFQRYCGNCDFQRIPGYLFSHDGDPSRLLREESAAADAGLAVSYLSQGAPGMEHLGPALRFENQARIDMGHYMDALARELHRSKCVFVRAEATEISGGKRPTVTVQGKRLSANAVVVATNVPFHQTNSTFHKQAPYRSYAIAGEIAKDTIPDALYWDDGDPYHYVRLHGGRDGKCYLIVGGGDHKTGQGDDPQVYARLQQWTNERFPGVTQYTYAWSGQVLEPADGLAFIGADPDNENVYLVTGDSGNGVTHGTLAGMLITDLIEGQQNPWTRLYDPGRNVLHSAGEWLKENVNAGAQYRDWLLPGEIASTDELAAGTGGILRHGVHKVAVYRAGDGRLHAHNARCPHLGCVVRWSTEEKSWDCPCHGSRFEARSGAILNGPTSEPLAPFEHLFEPGEETNK